MYYEVLNFVISETWSIRLCSCSCWRDGHAPIPQIYYRWVYIHGLLKLIWQLLTFFILFIPFLIIRPCMDLRIWFFREGRRVPLVNQVSNCMNIYHGRCGIVLLLHFSTYYILFSFLSHYSMVKLWRVWNKLSEVVVPASWLNSCYVICLHY